MIRALLLIVLAAGTLTVPRPMPAQVASAALEQGVRAYDDLELDRAAGLLRRALAVQGTGALLPNDLSRALIYLASTELLRERRDSARAITRRLVLSNPRFRPDELVFPPQVLHLYDEIRRTTPVVIALAPTDTAIHPGVGALTVQLYASTFHEVVATLAGVDGSVVRTLYLGPIADSLVLHWNGLDSTGTRPPPSGRYVISVSSLDRTRRVVRMLRIPLEVLQGPVDTLPHPPPPADSTLLPERRPIGPALRVLVPGLLAGAAIATLPSLIARDEDVSGARFVVGAAVSIAGIAAFVSRRPGRAIPANIAHNRVIRDWRRAVANVIQRNAERSRELIGVRTDSPVILTPEAR